MCRGRRPCHECGGLQGKAAGKAGSLVVEHAAFLFPPFVSGISRTWHGTWAAFSALCWDLTAIQGACTAFAGCTNRILYLAWVWQPSSGRQSFPKLFSGYATSPAAGCPLVPALGLLAAPRLPTDIVLLEPLQPLDETCMLECYSHRAVCDHSALAARHG